MEVNWEEFKEKSAKELEEATKSFFQKTLQEIEEAITSSESRIREIIKDIEDETLSQDKIRERFNNSLQEIFNEQKSKMESVFKDIEEAFSKELDEAKAKLASEISKRVETIEQDLDAHLNSAIEPEKINELLNSKIKSFFENETHIFEDKISNIAKEVIEKNQKDIKKNIEKAIKAFYDTEDGLRKVILDLAKNQSEYIASEIKEKISELISSHYNELLFESPLSDKIAEIAGFEIKKYMTEIENIKSTIDVIEMKLKILSELPNSEMEKTSEEQISNNRGEELHQVTLFPEDEGVEEIAEHPTTSESIAEIPLTEEQNWEEEIETPKGSESEKTAEQEIEVIEEKLVEETVVEEKPKIKGRNFRLESPVEITYFGHCAFLISGKGARILTDPYKSMALNNSIKYAPIDVEADFVTISHMHMDQGAWKEVPGSPKLVEAPGEKTFSGYPFLKFKGIPTYHDNAEGNVRGGNMVYNIEISGVRITHLGALGHILSREQIREIGRPVDILIVPVGGYDTIPVKDAWEVVNQLDPLVVIPMRFKTDACDLPLAEVDAFTSLVTCPVKLLESSLTVNELPTSLEVWVLKPLKV
ncbi:MAG TPA: MBL fold metallo-hydrolase [Candidatus Hydrothermia bacterium]|nr:MBL fold metallo-hydrolase [Candidatus Hydrothermia bacterium]HOL23817.1 MBL fold metallo-hydrolase [Candidatus Hydrothermia bacterium]HPO78822.1 MBL fold metallo-hydrolase [Candidatus Hydrothermia bacterium]